MKTANDLHNYSLKIHVKWELYENSVVVAKWEGEK